MTRKILLIEDNEQNAYLVGYLLEARGWQVVRAADGPTGLDMAEREAPDLILLDIQLPGMHGYEVARKLRGMNDLADTPVVAVTSYAMPGDRESCLEAGCSDYLEKPIDPHKFADRVEQNLEVDS